MSFLRSILQLCSSYPVPVLVLQIVGGLWLVRKLFRVILFVYDYFLARPFDIFARYGSRDSWAVVTGATSGIGLGYARVLARLGFNLVLVGRNDERLRKTREGLLLQNSAIRVHVVVQDFNRSFSEDAYSAFISAMKDREIALLINNVGVVSAGDFHTYPLERLLELMNVNIEATTFVTRLVVPLMLARQKRCGVITISSCLGQSTFPYCGVYAATKAYVTYLSKSLSLEYSGRNIDFLAVHTGQVTTQTNVAESPMHVAPEEAAEAHLRFLGRRDETYGHVRHVAEAVAIGSGWFNEKIGADMRIFYQKEKLD